MDDTDTTPRGIRGVLASFNARDRDAFRDLLREDARLDVGGTGVVIEGRDEVVAAVAFTFDALPDLRVATELAFADGAHGVAEVVRTGTHTGRAADAGGGVVEPSGNPVRLPECALFTIRGGRVARMAVYSDRAHTARQFGMGSDDGG